MFLRKVPMILLAVLMSVVLFSCATDDPLGDIVADDDQTVLDNSVVNDNENTDTQVSDDTDKVAVDNETKDDVAVDEMNDESLDESSDNAQVDENHDMESSDNDASSNLNTGDISGQQALAGNPGFACTKDSDCNDWAGTGNDDSQLAICLLPAEGYPLGYCSFMCDSSVNLNHGCNGYNGVYHGWGTYGDGYCFHACDDPNDCRVGYRCSQTVGACMPDCAVDACKKGTCDEEEKVCL